MPSTALHVIVHGRVQGVGFRRYVLSIAKDIKGFVRNLPSGEVEALFIGANAQEKIEKLKSGPGDVKAITVNEITTDQVYDDFRILT